MIQAEKGHNSLKLEEKMFVLKWQLDNNTQDCSHSYATSLDFRLYSVQVGPTPESSETILD